MQLNESSRFLLVAFAVVLCHRLYIIYLSQNAAVLQVSPKLRVQLFLPMQGVLKSPLTLHSYSGRFQLFTRRSILTMSTSAGANTVSAYYSTRVN